MLNNRRASSVLNGIIQRKFLVVSRAVDQPLDMGIIQRTVLSLVTSVFDPIGLVALHTVIVCLLLKDVREKRSQKEDNDLSEGFRGKCLEWHSGLLLLGQLTLHRNCLKEPKNRIELHMFGDSLQDGFCAVGLLHARLISLQKSKVQPIFLQ